MQKSSKRSQLIGMMLALGIFVLVGQTGRAEEYITDPSLLPDQEAYKAVVLIKAFTSHDGDNLVQYSSGSGIIISNDGVILTNHHVVTLEDEFKEGEYNSTFQICLTSSIEAEPDCLYAAKLIAKDKDQDLALLKIEPITGLSTQSTNFKYLNLAATDSTSVNNQVIVMGYPAIGGNTITITKGVISGKEEKYNKKWLKTDAVSSFGSSGGAAIDMQGKMIGLVNSSHSDYLGSLGYLINMASISDWINSNKSIKAQDNAYLAKVKNLAKKQKELKTSNSFSNDYFSFTKPAGWEFVYDSEGQVATYDPSDDDGGALSVTMYKYPFALSQDMILTIFKESMISGGLLTMVNFSKVEDTKINNQVAKKIVITVAGTTKAFYYLINKNYLIEVDYDYGLNDKDQGVITDAINTIKLSTSAKLPELITKHVNKSPQFSLQASGDWKFLVNNSKTKPTYLYNTKNSKALMYVAVERGDQNTKDYNNEEYLNYLKDAFKSANTLGANIDFKMLVNADDINYKLNNELNSVIYLDSSAIKLSTGEVVSRDADYIIKSGDKFITLTLRVFSNNDKDFTDALALAQDTIKSFSLTATPVKVGASTPSTVTPPVITPTKPIVIPAKGSFMQRVTGRILLQVEKNGEAWYVRPDNQKRIYLKDGEAAYALMRTIGLGITNKDLEKIPVGFEDRFVCEDSDNDGLCNNLEDGLGTDPTKADTDGDGHKDGDEVKNNYSPLNSGKLTYNNTLINKLMGKIVLQVEAHGEAWYINPVDGKRYYMPDGPSAYQIMRYLSLGINDKDLSSIPEDN